MAYLLSPSDRRCKTNQRPQYRLSYEHLGDPARIERLRWHFLERWERVFVPRIRAAWDEVRRLGEAFAPNRTGAPPLHLVFWKERDAVSWDNDFWEYSPGKFISDGTLVELGEVGNRLHWEETVLVEKWKRVTEEKLVAGENFQAIDGLWRWWAGRLERVNRLLATSVMAIGILPKEISESGKHVNVLLNGRRYQFKVTSYSSYPEFDNWPRPDTELTISVPAQFQIDEDLLGKTNNVVLARFGDPSCYLMSRKDLAVADIWIYGAAGIKFKGGGWNFVVEKILDAKTVTRLLRTAKRLRK